MVGLHGYAAAVQLPLDTGYGSGLTGPARKNIAQPVRSRKREPSRIAIEFLGTAPRGVKLEVVDHTVPPELTSPLAGRTGPHAFGQALQGRATRHQHLGNNHVARYCLEKVAAPDNGQGHVAARQGELPLGQYADKFARGRVLKEVVDEIGGPLLNVRQGRRIGYWSSGFPGNMVIW